MKTHFIILAVTVCAIGFVQAELKSVAILFRHGERTPAMTLGTFGFSQPLKELGFGELTLGGSKQLYEVGVDLRNRYSSLLPSSGYFRSSNMQILSSSVPRCITSLSSFMAGFMPPPNSDKTIPFAWQAFPFAVDNEGRVVTLIPESCPAYLRDFNRLGATIDNDPTIISWLAQDAALLKRVGDYMGTTLKTFMDAGMAAEMLRTQQFLENLPSWLISAFAQLQRYFTRYADLYHQTQLMKKVRGGPMITQMIDNMYAVKDETEAAKKVLIYSAHDFTLVSLLTVLGVKSQAPQIAAYGDTIAVEMHQSGRAEPEVKVIYISNTLPFKFKIELFVPNCGRPCKLNKFNSLMSQYIVKDLDVICG